MSGHIHSAPDCGFGVQIQDQIDSKFTIQVFKRVDEAEQLNRTTPDDPLDFDLT